MNGAIQAGEVLSLVGINIAVIAACVIPLTILFNRSFISERQELDHIRQNTVRLEYLAISLADSAEAMTAILKFQEGLIARLVAETGVGKALPRLHEARSELFKSLERALFELQLIGGEPQEVVSAAQHLAQDLGTFRSLKLLEWASGPGRGEDGEVRRHLLEQVRIFESRLDGK